MRPSFEECAARIAISRSSSVGVEVQEPFLARVSSQTIRHHRRRRSPSTTGRTIVVTDQV